MNSEIERKFLVKSMDFKDQATHSVYIKQAYLNSDPERVVRVRIAGEKAYLTIKGKGKLSRHEWEREIEKEEAEDLLMLCERGVIEKTRFTVPVDVHVFEVDEFCGENAGLFVAEVELNRENEPFVKPQWLGEEVTGDSKYYNNYLREFPFSAWANKQTK